MADPTRTPANVLDFYRKKYVRGPEPIVESTDPEQQPAASGSPLDYYARKYGAAPPLEMGSRSSGRPMLGVPAGVPPTSPLSPPSPLPPTSPLDASSEASPSVVQRILDPFGTTGSFMRGVQSGGAASISALGTLAGADEFADRWSQTARKYSQGQTQLSEIDGLRTGAKWLYGLLGQSAPEMAAVTAATIAGSVVGTPITGVAAGYTTSALFHSGRNLQRQEQETGQEYKGRAIVWGLAQAGLDVLVPGKLGGLFTNRVLGAADDVILRSPLREVATDTLVESGTELTQQLIEIGQANPELLRVIVDPRSPEESQVSDQLLLELTEAAIGGAAAGAAISSVARAGAPAQSTETLTGTETDFSGLTDEQLGTSSESPSGGDTGAAPLMLPPPPKSATATPALPAPVPSPGTKEQDDAQEEPLLAPAGVQEEPAEPAPSAGSTPAPTPVLQGEILPPESPTKTPVSLFKPKSYYGNFKMMEKLGYFEDTEDANNYHLFVQNGLDDDTDHFAKIADSTTAQEAEYAVNKSWEAYTKWKLTAETMADPSPSAEPTAAEAEVLLNAMEITQDQLTASPRLQQLYNLAISPGAQEAHAYDAPGLVDLVRAVRDAGVPQDLTDYVKSELTKRGDQADLRRLTAQVQAFNELRGELDRLGLGKVSFKPQNVANKAGYWSPLENTIYANLTEVEDPFTTIHHEAIHALRSYGVFDTPEGMQLWTVLSDYVNETGIPERIQQSYNPRMWVEETIAELYGQYANLRNATIKARREKVPFYILQALSTIRKGFEVIKSWVEKVTGAGLTQPIKTPWDAAEYIFKGKLRNVTIQQIGGSQFYNATKTTRAVENVPFTISERKIFNRVKQTADYYNFIVKWGWNVIQLAQKNPHLAWLQEYVQRANQWANEKAQWLFRANETIAAWNKLPVKEQEALAKLMFDLEHMNYRSPQEVQQGVVRRPTKQELAALARAAGIKLQATLDVYVRVRGDFDAMLKKMEDIAVKDAGRIFASNPIAFQLEEAKIRREFSFLRKKPYFPHARFGRYTLVGKSAKGKTVYMEAFESRKARDRAYAAVRAKLPQNVTLSKSMLPEEVDTFRGLPPSLLTMIYNNLNLSQSQKDAMEQLMIHASPTQSFKHHMTHRKDIEGFSRNALRAYADYFFHGANHIARLEFAPELQQAIKNGEADITQMMQVENSDSRKRVAMLDYLRNHLANILNPKPEWAALRSAGFLWWLGFNVKSAMLNFTQLPLTTAPFLSAQFGDHRALPAMIKAMTSAQQAFRSPTKAVAKLTPEDARAVSLGIEQNFLDESFASQLAGVAEGNVVLTRFGSGAHQRWLKFQAVAAAMFKTTELINRRVTFMATLNLARSNPQAKYLQEIRSRYNLELQELLQNGWTDKEAVAFLAGKDAVRRTQFEYAAWARPRFMQGRKSAFFTFASFSQNMLWFLQNSPGNTRSIITLLALAGVMGLPFADDLEELAKFLARQFGWDLNLEKEMREMVLEVTGGEIPPDLFLRGASRYGFGLGHLGDMMGVPLPTVDLSGSMGMGSPLPVISPVAQALGEQGDLNEKIAAITTEGVGATFGIGIGILQSVSDMQLALDDPKRWEKAMPAAVASLSKAGRYWNEGMERNRSGGELIEFDPQDPVHTAEIIAQGLGFRITRSAQAWDKVIMQREAEEFWQTRRGVLLTAYDHARMSKDKEQIQSALAAVRRFNSQLPKDARSLAITFDTLKRSAAARDRTRAKFTKGIPNSKMMRGIYREVERLHPETRMEPAVTEENLPRGR